MSKLTHVYRKLPGKEQTPIGGSVGLVWGEICWATLDPDGGNVLLVPCHQFALDDFKEGLNRGRYNESRLHTLASESFKQTVHVPAHKGFWKEGLRPASCDDPRWIGYESEFAMPAGATKKTVEEEVWPHLRTKRWAQRIEKSVNESVASLLVIWEPDGDDLDYLPELHKRCPDLDIVIFHRASERWGVEIIGGDDPATMWDTKSQAESEPDLQWVISLLAHTGESTWFGALPKVGKTWVLLCILKSLLTGEPLFGDPRLTVPHKSKRAIYLCPEAGMSSMRSRLKKLGLIEHLYDPITNPEGRLYLRTLSKGQKLPLDDHMLLEMAKGADIFIDTAIRYLEGDENSSKDVKVLTENVLNLLSSGARSLWVAHHAPKGFENASSMSLQNMFRGSGEYGAALSNAYGLCTEDEAATKIRFHCISGRDLDEPIPDMILVGRPYLNNIGNFFVESTSAEPFKGKTAGAKETPDKQLKITFAKSVEGSLQDKADAVNEKFGSNHDKSTIYRWLNPKFDKDNPKEQNDANR
jgi:hypothetical protein